MVRDGGSAGAGGGGGGDGSVGVSTGVLVTKIGAGVRVGVGVTTVIVGEGVLVGDSVGVAVGVGDGVKARTVAVAPASVYLVISESASDDTACISCPDGSVMVSISVSQAAAPSLTIRCVPSSSTLMFRSAGTLKIVTMQAGTTNSYVVSCATNSSVPFCNITCKRGDARRLCNCIVAWGASSRVLPSPRRNWTLCPTSVVMLISSSTTILALPSIVVHPEEPGHCTCTLPACSWRLR